MLQPPRLFQTNSHFRLGAIDTESGWGTGTDRSLGKTNRNGTNGCASKASAIASILMRHRVVPLEDEVNGSMPTPFVGEES